MLTFALAATAAIWAAEPGEQELRKHELWNAYIQAKAIGDKEAQDRAFDQFRQLRDAYAGGVFESAGYLFLGEGLRELSLKNYEPARSELLNAVKMNPHIWPAYEGLARIRKERDGDYRGYVHLNLKGLGSAFDLNNAYFILEALSWLLKNMLWTFMIAISIFAALLCLKYVRPWFATTAAYFEQRGLGRVYANLFSLCLALTPLALGFNFLLAAACYLVFFIPFFESRERRAAAVALVLIALSPLLHAALARVSQVRADPLLRAHLAQFFEGDIQAQIDYLRQNPGKGELKHYSWFLIGQLQQMDGDVLGAMQTYGEIPQSADIWPKAQVNLGNIHFGEKEFQEAVEAYNAAIQKDGDQALAHYNLSVVKNQMGEHREAEIFRARALDKDPDLRSRLVLFGQVGDDAVVDAKPNYRKRLLQALFGFWEDAPWQSSGFIGSAVIGALLLVLALLHTALRNARLLARACAKCDRVFFQSDSPDSQWCGQCVSIYVKKEDLPSEAKARKYAEVKVFNKRNRRINIISQLTAPGARSVLRGGAISGLIALFVWIFLIVNFLHPITGVNHPFLQYLEAPFFIAAFNLGALLLYWLIFGLRPIWQEE